jgi:1-acyl-sn-glycerol-3-phosphate acyltransferase
LALIIRSVIFNVLFYVNLIVHMVVALPMLLLPYRILLLFIRSYAKSSLWLLRVCCGTRVEWRGLEKMPPGSCIVASKHQSLWETFALFAALNDPIYILKRELMWIPFFGWYTWKADMIPVDRGAGSQALAKMTDAARVQLQRSRELIIFPEGTRRPPGAEPRYKFGVAYLYAETGAPCVPLALNSGLFWPRRSFRRYPGTVVVEALDPIAPGLDKQAFAEQLQNRIEAATARLLAEGERELIAEGLDVKSSPPRESSEL